MTHIEKVKHIREVTLSPMTKIADALLAANGNVSDAIAILIKQKDADIKDMENRKADNNIVYSYVHNNKIGAMIVLSCQTDFVAKNEVFIQLAKDICMHVVSSPVTAEYISDVSIPKEILDDYKAKYIAEAGNKPQPIIDKIVLGKIQKFCSEHCLLNQRFIKDDTLTVQQLINKVSASVGEKIELKKFVRMVASV